MPNIGKDMEQLELSHTAGMCRNVTITFRTMCQFLIEVEQMCTLWSICSSTRYLLNRNENMFTQNLI